MSSLNPNNITKSIYWSFHLLVRFLEQTFYKMRTKPYYPLATIYLFTVGTTIWRQFPLVIIFVKCFRFDAARKMKMKRRCKHFVAQLLSRCKRVKGPNIHEWPTLRGKKVLPKTPQFIKACIHYTRGLVTFHGQVAFYNYYLHISYVRCFDHRYYVTYYSGIYTVGLYMYLAFIRMAICL